MLRRTSANWLLLNKDMPDLSIVLGFSGKIPELVDEHEVKKSDKSIELIRRYTGGGTVIVDDSTFFTSFIMNNKDADCKPYPRDIMQWSNIVFQPVFENFGGNVQFALNENDYVLNDLKIGGNAQTIIKDRWVHHTSFLWDFKAENMKYLLMPKKRPEYRRDRDHLDFLDRVNNHIESKVEFEKRILEASSQFYDIEEIDFEETEQMILQEIERTKDNEKEMKMLVRTRVEPLE